MTKGTLQRGEKPERAAGAWVLTPFTDGTLTSPHATVLPFMAPRLQGDVWPDGRLDLSVWGVGRVARLRFPAIAGPYRYSPNRVEGADGGVHVAHSAPAMVLLGVGSARIFPARRCAKWHDISAADARPTWRTAGGRREMQLPWGHLLAEQRGRDLVIAAGASRAEAERGLNLTVAEIVAEADGHARRCDLMPDADPVLRSMVMQGVHASLSSIRRDEAGAFAGLAAGQAYSSPARTYYRDGYWTLQLLLKLEPEAVRDQIRLLARGVQPDGEAPSGIILSGAAQSAAWRVYRDQPERYKEHHLRPEDWWSDHFDSPLFFVLALGDYVAATGDTAEAGRHWPVVTAIIERYFRMSGPHGLPMKPRNDRDWADNVYREGLVAYDLGLWIGALDVVARLGATLDPSLAQRCKDAAARGRKAIESLVWLDDRQNAADYRTDDGFIEDHTTLDSLTLARYSALPEPLAIALLRKVEQSLETRHNPQQPYGDWGVMCAYPSFKRPRDIRAKTAFAFRYHNGSDWPYLDGLYAGERLRRGLGGARYALTRWWEMCLENGWAGPVEYFAPPFGRGSLLQGWSAMPATVALEYGAAAVGDAPAEPQKDVA